MVNNSLLRLCLLAVGLVGNVYSVTLYDQYPTILSGFTQLNQAIRLEMAEKRSEAARLCGTDEACTSEQSVELDKLDANAATMVKECDSYLDGENKKLYDFSNGAGKTFVDEFGEVDAKEMRKNLFDAEQVVGSLASTTNFQNKLVSVAQSLKTVSDLSFAETDAYYIQKKQACVTFLTGKYAELVGIGAYAYVDWAPKENLCPLFAETTEVYILQDIHQSMSDIIAKFKKEVVPYLSQLNAHTNVKVGLGTFSDEGSDAATTFTNVLSLTSDLTKLEEAYGTLELVVESNETPTGTPMKAMQLALTDDGVGWGNSDYRLVTGTKFAFADVKTTESPRLLSYILLTTDRAPRNDLKTEVNKLLDDTRILPIMAIPESESAVAAYSPLITGSAGRRGYYATWSTEAAKDSAAASLGLIMRSMPCYFLWSQEASMLSLNTVFNDVGADTPPEIFTTTSSTTRASTATLAPGATPMATLAPGATPMATLAPGATPMATLAPGATVTVTLAPGATVTTSAAVINVCAWSLALTAVLQLVV